MIVIYFFTVSTFLVSVVTGNVSQVDKLWTVLPTIYTAYYALSSSSPRPLLMLSLVVVWMTRLSYNTYRRGLFNWKDEDYRWAVLRSQLHPLLFQLTNLVFISATQNILLYLLAIPTLTATQQHHSSLATSDYILAASALIVLAFEFTADNQQFAYQTYKHAVLSETSYNPMDQWPGARLAWTHDDAKRGFVTRGLWRYSRHPNFACEQTFWWIITLFPLLAPSPPNLTRISTSDISPIISNLKHLLPALALSALFFSSTLYTEAISESKYPLAYRAYKTRVGMFSFTTTLLKGVWLSVVGDKESVESLVWGQVVEKGKAE